MPVDAKQLAHIMRFGEMKFVTESKNYLGDGVAAAVNLTPDTVLKALVTPTIQKIIYGQNKIVLTIAEWNEDISTLTNPH